MSPPLPYAFPARIWVPSARCLSSHRAGRSQAQASSRRPRQLVAPGGPWKLEAAISSFLARFARGGAPRADATGVARRKKGEKRAGSAPVPAPRGSRGSPNSLSRATSRETGRAKTGPRRSKRRLLRRLHRARWPTGWAPVTGVRLPRGRRVPRPAANATSGRSFPRDFAPDST